MSNVIAARYAPAFVVLVVIALAAPASAQTPENPYFRCERGEKFV